MASAAPARPSSARADSRPARHDSFNRRANNEDHQNQGLAINLLPDVSAPARFICVKIVVPRLGNLLWNQWVISHYLHTRQ